jgi:hypothetical protein
MSELIAAFGRARSWHKRYHAGPLKGCPDGACTNRVIRLLSGRMPWTIAPYEENPSGRRRVVVTVGGNRL